MVRITDAEFEALVGEVFDALPEDMVRPLENVAILIQDQPAGARPRLFGLYSGHPLTRRGVYGFGELPDRITLFRNNLEASCSTVEELRARVRVTLVHEIGHYFGLTDARLHDLGWA
ncbi:metallopeptidase family protein [uncultured Leifsonia sp.]|uniref:metallopeptidase family protein n=1 Tax=uncultured Leifsonia sp. TaxID=340359 RepID=UPI0028D6BF36|nr:metallopeptidase family protein [uncultured Leifsonia sp.]